MTDDEVMAEATAVLSGPVREWPEQLDFASLSPEALGLIVDDIIEPDPDRVDESTIELRLKARPLPALPAVVAQNRPNGVVVDDDPIVDEELTVDNLVWLMKFYNLPAWLAARAWRDNEIHLGAYEIRCPICDHEQIYRTPDEAYAAADSHRCGATN